MIWPPRHEKTEFARAVGSRRGPGLLTSGLFAQKRKQNKVKYFENYVDPL